MSELFFTHGTRGALTCQDCSSNIELEGLNMSGLFFKYETRGV
jgi:hypothetical protein